MADNVTLSPGALGDTIAADDDGTAKHQWVKLKFGADGTFTAVDATNPLPIELFDAGGISVPKNEDATHGTGDPGIMALVVRNDTLAALADTDGDYAPIQVDASGAVYMVVASAIAAGANLIGDVGIQGRATGGLTPYYDNDLDETAIAVKASAGTLYAIHAINLTAAPKYLQLFDVAQGSVTVGTTTPTLQFVIPANADSDGAGFTFTVPQGIAFGTAITAAASTTSEGATGPGVNEVHCNLFYA